MVAGHDHDHAPTDHGAAFKIGILLNLGFVAIEAGYGFAADSMALLADAGHNLSDVLGLVVAFIGARLVKREPTARFTYGLKKSSILAALANALLLLIAVGAIGAEAIRRLFDPQPSDGTTVMWVAGIGIVVNAVTAMLFARGRKRDINIRGAYLHMVADAVVSAGVVLAGLMIVWTGREWIDPVTSLIVAGVILWGTWDLLVEAMQMTLAGTPRGLEPKTVGEELERLEGVSETHHLHLWSLSTTETAMTVHLVVEEGIDRDHVIRSATRFARERFGIAHSTIQVESGGMGKGGCLPGDEGAGADCGHC